MRIFERGIYHEQCIYPILSGQPDRRIRRMGGHFDFAGRPDQPLVLEWRVLD
jgi:hypothetical protein